MIVEAVVVSHIYKTVLARQVGLQTAKGEGRGHLQKNSVFETTQ